MVTEKLTIKDLQQMKAARLGDAFAKIERAIKNGSLKQVAPPKIA
ncbi:hypothetical protein [Pseudomonas lijiangensis]|nr:MULTISPECIES: hypothetical protein [Pseudomonas syringae group]